MRLVKCRKYTGHLLALLRHEETMRRAVLQFIMSSQRLTISEITGFLFADTPCMPYMPTLGWFGG